MNEDKGHKQPWWEREEPAKAKIGNSDAERSALRFRKLPPPREAPAKAKRPAPADPAIQHPLPSPKPVTAPAATPPQPRHSTAPPARQVADKAIAINISLPKLPKPSLGKVKRVSRKLPRRTALKAGLVLVVILGILGTIHAFTSGAAPVATKVKKPGKSTSQTPAAAPGQLAHESPKYDTILPSGKDIKALGGWTRVSPPNSDPVYAYVDKIGAIQINVSEQPLPEDFKEDTASQVAELAKNFNATQKVPAGALTLYIGTSAKGPQSVITTKNDILILIKSTAPLANDQWAAYVNTLQ